MAQSAQPAQGNQATTLSPQAQSEADMLAAYRSSIEDTIGLLKGIGPLCSSIDQLIDMLRLATENDSQLHLILRHVEPPRLRGR